MSIMAREILNQIVTLRTRGEEFCVVTVVRTANATSAKAGAKAVVTRDGMLSGFIGGSCVQGSVRQAAQEALREGTARLIRVRPKEDVADIVDADGVELHGSACPSGGTVELFIEPMVQAKRVIVFGVSPVGAALVSLAVAMGYRTLVACPADERGRMPGADGYIDGFHLESNDVTAADAVIVATQGRGDRQALEQAVKSQADYVAFVGSHAKAAKLKQDLTDGGCDAALLERVKAPAGLDIGAIEPEEIAVSIIGEVIQRRREKDPLLEEAIPRTTPAEPAHRKAVPD